MQIKLQNIINKFVKPVYAHCDLPCGVYDPAQARIEAESVLGIMKKYEALNPEDKWRAVFIKEQRADLVKQHLWILWTDYFKPEHLAVYPDLHDLIWRATKQAGVCKKTVDVGEAEKLLALIAEIDVVYKQSKQT